MSADIMLIKWTYLQYFKNAHMNRLHTMVETMS